MTLVFSVFALLSLLVVFRSFFKSRFDLTLSDPVDGRFCVAVLEHWHNVLQGKGVLTSPPFFYPERDVLGYSDAFFLYAPPYCLARSLGCDRYLALELTMMCFTLVGFFAMLYLLRAVLGFTRTTALIGASLFVTLNSYYIHLVHPHLASVVIIPVLWSLAAKYCQAMNSSRWLARLYVGAFATLLGSLLFTSFYIGWFTIIAGLTGGIFFVAFELVAERGWQPLHKVLIAVRLHGLDFVIAGVTFLISMIPFVIVYLPALKKTGTRPWEYTLYFMLPALGVFDVGRYNLLWGRLAGQIEDLISAEGIREHPAGWPLLTICLFLVTTSLCAQRAWRLKATKPVERRLLNLQLAVSLTCITLWFSAIRLGRNFAFWWVLWKFVPGASAIRIPPRINLVLNVGVVIVCMFGFEKLRRAMSRYSKGRNLVIVLLGVGLFIEQLNLMPTHLVSRSSEARKFSKITRPPAACSEFYVSSWSNRRPLMLEFQIDAMLMAEEFGIPTLNGYSSWFPKDWDLLSGSKRRIAEDAIDWAQRHQLPDSLCSLDLSSGDWSIADTTSSIELGQPLESAIVNPGFESGSLLPWAPFHGVSKITSERARSGRYSIAEQVGESSVYQDVRGLQPKETYTVSAWVSGSPGCSANAQIAIVNPGSKDAVFSSSREPCSRWELLTESFTVSESGTARIHLFRKQGSGTIYWDDVRIYRDHP